MFHGRPGISLEGIVKNTGGDYFSGSSNRFQFKLISETPDERVYKMGFEDNIDWDYNDIQIEIRVPRPYFKIDGSGGECN